MFNFNNHAKEHIEPYSDDAVYLALLTFVRTLKTKNDRVIWSYRIIATKKKTLKELATYLKLSNERVRQIESAILRRFQSVLAENNEP